MTNFLERIPDEELSSEQKAFQPVRERVKLPMYKLLREPSSLDDFDWDEFQDIVIWCSNRTSICISKSAYTRFREHIVSFTLHNVGKFKELICCIYGESDNAISETVTFFCSLKHPGEGNTCLEIRPSIVQGVYGFNVGSLQGEQLTRILDANPTRQICFRSGIWGAANSVILATRPYPLNLKITASDFVFQDDGTAFVDALEKRISPFGALTLHWERDGEPFDRTNVIRLLNLNVFEKLTLGPLSADMVFLPFSTQVKTLEYHIEENHFQTPGFESVDIVAKDLSLTVCLNGADNWDELLASILNRVASLGDIERFDFSVDYYGGEIYMEQFDMLENYSVVQVAKVAEAFVRVIKANPKMTYLSLSRSHWRWDWSPHLQNIFKSLEDNEGLRTFVVDKYPPEDSNYSMLKQLLVRNRRIMVLDTVGKRYTDGSNIDKIYLINCFYCRLAILSKDESPLRPSLFAAMLAERLSHNYQNTALFLADNTDMLQEFIQALNQEELDVSQVMSEGANDWLGSTMTDSSKRKSNEELSRAYKAARSDACN
jgi:hypothetical protein